MDYTHGLMWLLGEMMIFGQSEEIWNFFSQISNSPTSINNQENLTEKNLSKIINTLGQEIQSSLDRLLFYIYDDGTVEKRIVIE
jgi:hypothetical protein